MIIKKYIFATFFVSIFGFDCHIMAMKKNISKKIFQKKSNIYFPHFYTTENNKNIHTHGSIVNYDEKKHEKAIHKIAIPLIVELVSSTQLNPFKIGKISNKAKEEAWEDTIKKAITTPNIYTKVFLLDNVPVGFINYSIPTTFINNPYSNQPRKAHINFFAVNQKNQGKGIGRALYDEAIDHMRKQNVEIIRLGTTATVDRKAINLYRKDGFQEIRFPQYACGDTEWEKRLPVERIEQEPFFDIFQWVQIFEEKKFFEDQDNNQDDCYDVNNLAHIFNQISIDEEK